MFKHTKKILSILMMVVMLIGCFSVSFSVFAEDEPEYKNKLIYDADEVRYYLADANGTILTYEEDPLLILKILKY